MLSLSLSASRAARVLLVSTLVCVLTACAPMYRAQPYWGAGGYSSKDIDATTVSVNYLSTNPNVDLIKKYALYRASEITLERGYDGFVVLKGTASGVSGPYIYSSSSTIVIRMFKGTQDKPSPYVDNKSGPYMAKALMEKLEPSIRH